MDVEFNNDCGIAVPDGFEADALSHAREFFSNVNEDVKTGVASLVEDTGASVVKDDSMQPDYGAMYPGDSVCLRVEAIVRGSDEPVEYDDLVCVPGYHLVNG